MKYKIIVITIISALLLTSCATPGGGFYNTNVKADAGKAPTSYEEKIQLELKRSLKDPDSIKDFSIEPPVLTTCSVAFYGDYHGWRVNVEYNAKNSFGAYVGTQNHYYWFHGEDLKGVSKYSDSCEEAQGFKR